MYLFTLNTTVPTPSVTVTAPNTQIVGQPLSLTCNAVTVRGITRVDLIWSRDGSMLRRQRLQAPTATNTTSLMYTDDYTILQLSTNDDGGEYQCRINVRGSPIDNTDTVALDVAGK